MLAVDIPGEPGRSAETRPPLAGPAFAEWVGDVLDACGAATASIVGLSQGGWTALRFATLRPGRVERLALLAPAGVVSTRASFVLKAVLLSLCGRAEAVNRIVLGGDAFAPEAIDFMNAIMTHVRPRIEAEVLFTDEELRRLTMPVLLVLGARDALRASARIAARLQGLLPRLTTVLLPGAGHVLAGMAERVISFWQTVLPKGGQNTNI